MSMPVIGQRKIAVWTPWAPALILILNSSIKFSKWSLFSFTLSRNKFSGHFVTLNTLIKVASRLKESINELQGNNHKDQYVGQARVKVEPYTYKNQVRNFHDVSMYRNHKKPYNYYLSIVLAHNKTTDKVDYIVDTGTHILSKAGKWAQNFIKRRMGGTGRERFS